METFSIEVTKGQMITGRHCLPRENRTASKQAVRPLIVCIHGASYDSEYFDANADYSWSVLANAFGVPIVSIDRPGYGGSTELLDQNMLGGTDTPTPTQRQADFIHRSVIPLIWDRFGPKSGASSIVIMGHSVGGMVAIQTAAAHAAQNTSTYPLSGLIVSGVGCVWHQSPKSRSNDQTHGDTERTRYITFETTKKDFLMLDYNADKDLADLLINPGVLDLTERLNHPAPLAELIDIARLWRSYWYRVATKVKVPVFYALNEVDPWFNSSGDAVPLFASGFTNSSKVIRSRVTRAPHCMELSLQAKGWMLQCGGFALECAVIFQLSNRI